MRYDYCNGDYHSFHDIIEILSSPRYDDPFGLTTMGLDCTYANLDVTDRI